MPIVTLPSCQNTPFSREVTPPSPDFDFSLFFTTPLSPENDAEDRDGNGFLGIDQMRSIQKLSKVKTKGRPAGAENKKQDGEKQTRV